MRAFSLFELLIVMGIIGILAAISYPTYHHHMARVHCKQAHIALLEMAHQLEQEYSLNGDYQRLNIQLLIPQHARTLPYHFYFSHATHDHYTLNATAINPHQVSAQCRSLTLDNNVATAKIQPAATVNSIAYGTAGDPMHRS